MRAKERQTAQTNNKMGDGEVVDFTVHRVRKYLSTQQPARTYETAASEQQAERESLAAALELARLEAEDKKPLTPPFDINPYLIVRSEIWPAEDLPYGVECDIEALPHSLTSEEETDLAYENFVRAGGDLERAVVRRSDYGNLVVRVSNIGTNW